jgi:hypothetical protein
MRTDKIKTEGINQSATTAVQLGERLGDLIRCKLQNNLDEQI